MQELARLRPALADALATQRRDWFQFSFLTILLTPLAIVAALLLVFAAAMYADLPFVDHAFTSPMEALTGAGPLIVMFNVFLGFMFLALFNRQRGGMRGSAVLGALAAYAALLALSILTDPSTAQPQLFWIAYGALALLTLGLLGYAYAPGESYYLGWRAGPLLIDDPFTLRDDLDRGHVALGIAMAIPRMIVGSYAGVFGNLWLLTGLSAHEQAAACRILVALRDDPTTARNRMRSLGEGTVTRALRALEYLSFIRIRSGHPALTSKGTYLLAGQVASPWLVTRP